MFIRFRLRSLLIAASVAAGSLCAHPADISHLRVRIERERVEFRFSFNIATFERVVLVDANQDNKITFAEIEAAMPFVRSFLLKSVLVTINDADADIGGFQGYECIWPNARKGDFSPAEAGQRFVDFTFLKPWPSGVTEVWLGFEVFEQLGDLHTIQCIYQQPEEHDTPVEFSLNESEFLYDTGWTTVVAETPVTPVRRLSSWTWGITVAGVLACIALVCRWTGRKSAT